MEHQDLLSGLIRLHVLHHAVEDEVHGQWMIEELGRHGYRLSAGTLYPMLRWRKGLSGFRRTPGRSVDQACPPGDTAAKWADNRKVPQIAFKPEWTRHVKAAFKRNDQMLAVMPIGVIVFRGSGIQDNLADKARNLGIRFIA